MATEILEKTQVQQLMEKIDVYRFNPARSQRVILQHLKDVTEGRVDVVDASNPFVFNLEASSVNVANFMSQAAINNRKQYPVAALTPEDLYLHMSDKDYLGRFALPGKCSFTLSFDRDELINSLVLDPETGYRKIVIPRNSTVSVHGYTFTQEYPIEIRQLNHGGLQVVYDTTYPSPIQTITTNLLPRRTIRRNAVQTMLSFDYELMQFSIVSRTEDLQMGTNFSLTIPYDDQYYTARVYIQETDLSWTEIRTTHTEQVYDIMNMTAVLRVLPDSLKVNIPQVYTNMLQRQAKIRVDLYQTKGGLTLDMSGYQNSDFTMTWKPIDPRERTVYTAPLDSLSNTGSMIWSNDIASGGRNELSFQELRERVLLNAIGTPSIPITNVQIEKALQDRGYDIVPNIDVLTNRVFLATRLLPAPQNDTLITSAALSIQSGIFNMEDAVAVGTVIDNGQSITITPDTIWQNNNGKLNFVPKSTVDSIKNLPNERIAALITAGNYYFTPWHYVCELSKNEFDVRAYYLDNPVCTEKSFVRENDTTLIEVSTGGYEIFKDANGYHLDIVTASTEAFQSLNDNEIFVQLAFIPQGEKERAYQNGTLVGKDPNTGERKYRFSLASNFNVTKDNGLQLKDFFMFTTDPRIVNAPLETEFDIIYATSRQMPAQWKPDDIDDVLGRFILPSRIAGITHERLDVLFGKHLANLWTQARSFPGTIMYETYPENVYATYKEDVYKLDPVTGSPIIWENGVPTQTILHKKGDPILDSEGNQIILYPKGSVKHDADGEPIVLNGRKMYRQVDFMLAEAVYWFATDSVAIRYKKEMTDILVKWITEDLAELQDRLLEQTSIYFYPKTTTGMIAVIHGEGLTTNINAGQAFRVDLFVSAEVYSNTELRVSLNRKTVQTLGVALEGEVVSMSRATTALAADYGTDVISTRLSGLGGEANFNVVTVKDPTTRLSIRKKLAAQSDGYLIVQEDVTTNFIRHQDDE